ncbi:hypothetical protein [Pararhodonellum marinum]|uniref:hypothetical protein n=1 Tax=Pararhodonellum marinum TaxID=2755358 RepID=UPI00188E5FE2|nr:hypothetical protein [Pararhodonellum marinum]
MKHNLFRILPLILFLPLFSACFTYSDILKNTENKEAYVFSQMDFEKGKQYQIKTQNGKLLVLNLNELSIDGVKGKGTLKNIEGLSKPISDEYFVEFEKMVEVKRSKFNPYVSILIPVAILTGIAIFMSNNLNIGGTL